MKIMVLGTLPKLNKKGRSFGGAEKNMICLAGYLVNKGYDVSICSVEGDDLIYPVDDKVKVFLTHAKYKNKILLHLQTFFRTRKLIKQINPDVIVSFWLHPTFYAMTLFKRCKIIFCERNNPETIYSSFSKKILRYVLKKCQGLVFQTQGVINQFPNLELKNKSIVIPNPIYIDKEAFQYVESKDNRIVTIGRLTEQKNQKLLIDAFAKIEKTNPNIILEIYGEGPLKEMLQKQICDYHLENKVFLKGTSSDVLKLIHSAKLFVLTSFYEGMPNVLIEAQGLGIPCISSDCPPGGPAYLIDHRQTGLLFKNNCLDSLVEQMYFALESDDEIKKISKNAYNSVYVKHDINVIFGEWEAFINKIMKG